MVPPKTPFGQPAAGDSFEIEMPPEGGGSTRITSGPQPGKLVHVEKDTSKAGNPMWVWTFVITEGPHAGDEFKTYTALTPTAMWKVGETLRALGVGLDLAEGEKVTFTRQQVVGVRCVLIIKDDEYNGRETSSLDRIEPHSNGAGYKGKGAGVPVDARHGPAKAVPKDKVAGTIGKAKAAPVVEEPDEEPYEEGGEEYDETPPDEEEETPPPAARKGAGGSRPGTGAPPARPAPQAAPKGRPAPRR